MITQKDILNLSKVFATKEDLKDLEFKLTENMSTKEDINQILNTLDVMSKKMETSSIESLSLYAKVDRHEKWIQAIAKKTKVNLKY